MIRKKTPTLLAALCLSCQPAAAQIAFENVSGIARFGSTHSETWGAAWGDVDGDGYPDLFASNHRTRATLHRNNRDGTFSEVSQQVDASATPGWTGPRATLDTHGATWADIDGDGDDDLYQSVEASTDRLHINEGGVLWDRTFDYHVDRFAHRATRHNVFLDFTGDGRLDLASIALSGPGLSRQSADDTFGPETVLACADDGQWAHLADVHPSPGLELLCAPRNGSYPRVTAFGSGTPVDVSGQFPQFSPVIDVATFDYDRDLRPDLLILRGSERPSDAFQPSARRFEAQFVTAARNTKSVRFKTSGVVTITASLSVGADPQGDPAYVDIGATKWSPGSLTFQLRSDDSRNWGIGSGSPGINVGFLTASREWMIRQGNSGYSYAYVQVVSTEPISGLVFSGASQADRGYPPLLVRNAGSGFVPRNAAGLGASVRCQSVVTGDFDNDMDEDVFLACTRGSRNLPNRLYRNDGNGTFTEIAGAGGAAGPTGAAVGSRAGTSESVVTADYDLDGFLDLLVTNGNNMRPVYTGGAKQLFRNRGNANYWIQLDLAGTTSNRDGIGSRVHVRAGGVTQYREQNGGYHRWSQNFRRIHVGLGGNTRADVTVHWPNGQTVQYTGLAAGRLYRLRQDGTAFAQ